MFLVSILSDLNLCLTLSELILFHRLKEEGELSTSLHLDVSSAEMESVFMVCLHLEKRLGLLLELVLFQDILFPRA